MTTRCYAGLMLALLLAACSTPSQGSPKDHLRRGLEQLGSGPLTVMGEGTVDLDILQQGMTPGTSEPRPHQERLTVTADGKRFALDYSTPVNPDTREELRYIWDDEKLAGLVLAGGFGFWETRADFPPRLRGLVPHLLLADLMAHVEELKDLGPAENGGRKIEAQAVTGETLILSFEPGGALQEISLLLDIPLSGDTAYRVRYMPYEEVPGFGPYPGGYEIWLDGDLLKHVRYTEMQGHIDESLLAIPQNISMPPYEPAPENPAPPPAINFQDLAPGLYLARNVRPGFHHLVAEQKDGLVVVDAPAGWLEMHVVPPLEWVEGATSSSISRRFLEALKTRFPGKSVRTLVLAHWHSDHAGGVREFVARGAAVAATAPTRQVVERALEADFIEAPDTYSNRSTPPRFLDVEDTLILGSGPARLKLIETGPNPHSSSMLVVHAPEANIIYQADLFEPIPRTVFPPRQRLEIMRWFVTWLDRNGLEDTRILAAHALGEVEPWMLGYIRDMPVGDQREGKQEE